MINFWKHLLLRTELMFYAVEIRRVDLHLNQGGLLK